MSNKLSPIEQPYPSEVAGILAAYPQQDGYILSLFRTFANSLRFLKKGVPNLLDKESPLPLRIREIVIALVGTHHTISFVANTARLQNEQFGASFPA